MSNDKLDREIVETWFTENGLVINDERERYFKKTFTFASLKLSACFRLLKLKIIDNLIAGLEMWK